MEVPAALFHLQPDGHIMLSEINVQMFNNLVKGMKENIRIIQGVLIFKVTDKYN